MRGVAVVVTQSLFRGARYVFCQGSSKAPLDWCVQWVALECDYRALSAKVAPLCWGGVFFRGCEAVRCEVVVIAQLFLLANENVDESKDERSECFPMRNKEPEPTCEPFL